MRELAMAPIGVVRSTRVKPEDDDWDTVESFIELDPQRFGPEALKGLDAFSHVEVIFVFDQVDPGRVDTGARHPRNNAAWPEVGIFAQRAKNRPNRIGTTICRIDRVLGSRVDVTGLDAIDGSPVLDLKPWVREFGPRGEVRQPDWMEALMSGYWSA